jgi:hypothetical protein
MPDTLAVEYIASGEVVPCAVCGAPGRRYMNTKACPDHTPAKIAGHAEPPIPKCGKPLACYLPCCATKTQPPPAELRTELEHRIDEWRDYARGEIKVLAGLGYSFGPGDLAALLPVNLLGDGARDHLQALLEEGVKAGAIVAVGQHQWKGARS